MAIFRLTVAFLQRWQIAEKKRDVRRNGRSLGWMVTHYAAAVAAFGVQARPPEHRTAAAFGVAARLPEDRKDAKGEGDEIAKGEGRLG